MSSKHHIAESEGFDPSKEKIVGGHIDLSDNENEKWIRELVSLGFTIDEVRQIISANLYESFKPDFEAIRRAEGAQASELLKKLTRDKLHETFNSK